MVRVPDLTAVTPSGNSFLGVMDTRAKAEALPVSAFSGAAAMLGQAIDGAGKSTVSTAFGEGLALLAAEKIVGALPGFTDRVSAAFSNPPKM